MEQNTLQLYQKYPSVIQDHQHGRVSDRYTFIPTTRVVEVLDKHGWVLNSVKEIKVRGDGSRVGFQKHMLRFRQRDATTVQGIVPEAVLVNAHDGSACFNFLCGIFRVLCSNGLIVADALFGDIKVRHLGFENKHVVDAVYEVVKNTPKVLQRIEAYRGITLEQEEQRIFAQAALDLRYSADGVIVPSRPAMYQVGNRTFNTDMLTSPLRSEEREPTLWNTFNTIQERFVKGGTFEDTVLTAHNGRRRHQSKARGIGAINEDIRINKALWSMTEKMAQLKST